MSGFKPGIEMLLKRRRLAGARVGLVSHPAALDSAGASSAEKLHECKTYRLAALFGPEHGFFGIAGAGTSVAAGRHQDWRIPIYSLYGCTRRPTARMLRGLDLLVYDLQDLGARPYTYVSTLRYVLESAADTGLPVIVADRPIPLPRMIDGPMPEADLTSFVAAVPAPMCYGMTPGETALWLKHKLGLKVDVSVARMAGYRRKGARGTDWPPWLPPSPGIRSWETAQCYLATVFGEALPAVDIGLGTNLAFQVFGMRGMKVLPVVAWLRAQRLPGVEFYAHTYQSAGALTTLSGVRLAIVNPDVFRPVTTSLAIIECLQNFCGVRKIWGKGRLDFFDQLYACRSVRKGLSGGVGWRTISRDWRAGLQRFDRERRSVLLY